MVPPPSKIVIAEYVWLDTHKKYRSKCRTVLLDGETDIMDLTHYPEWNYDGSSTDDIIPSRENHNTECMLSPVAVYMNPFGARQSQPQSSNAGYVIRYVVVWCINFINGKDGTKTYIHPEHDKLLNHTLDTDEYKPIFGFEQEFFVIDKTTQWPVGFKRCPPYNMIMHMADWVYHWFTKKTTWRQLSWDFNTSTYMFPDNGPQGPYYCGNGLHGKFRDFINDTYEKLLVMGLKITGMNYEVAPGQAEFQLCDFGKSACDGMHMLRWVLIRNAEYFHYHISFEPVVIPGGQYNNTGCHVNFSTKQMRAPGGMQDINKFINLLDGLYVKGTANTVITKAEFEDLFGDNNCARLTGKLETSAWYTFTSGIGTRHTSIRIPTAVYADGCGYFEDRRPGGNVSPYKIASYYYDIVELSKIEPDTGSEIDFQQID